MSRRDGEVNHWVIYISAKNTGFSFETHRTESCKRTGRGRERDGEGRHVSQLKRILSFFSECYGNGITIREGI